MTHKGKQANKRDKKMINKNRTLQHKRSLEIPSGSLAKDFVPKFLKRNFFTPQLVRIGALRYAACYGISL